MAESRRTSGATGDHGDHVAGGTHLPSPTKSGYGLVSHLPDSAGTPAVRRPSHLSKQPHLSDEGAVEPHEQTGYPGQFPGATMLDPPPSSESDMQPPPSSSSAPTDHHESGGPSATMNDIKSTMHDFAEEARAGRRAALMMEVRQQEMMDQHRNDMDAIVKQLESMQAQNSGLRADNRNAEIDFSHAANKLVQSERANAALRQQVNAQSAFNETHIGQAQTSVNAQLSVNTNSPVPQHLNAAALNARDALFGARSSPMFASPKPQPQGPFGHSMRNGQTGYPPPPPSGYINTHSLPFYSASPAMSQVAHQAHPRFPHPSQLGQSHFANPYYSTYRQQAGTPPIATPPESYRSLASIGMTGPSGRGDRAPSSSHHHGGSRQADKPNRRHRSAQGMSPSDSDSSDSDSSDSDHDTRRARSSRSLGTNRSSRRSAEKDLEKKWKKFSFEVEKENHLKGFDNWELWRNALSFALEEVDYEEGMKLPRSAEVKLAKAIIKTCKQYPQQLITGMTSGTEMLKTLQSTFSTAGATRQRSTWDDFHNLKYDGGNPLTFTIQFQRYMREMKSTNMELGEAAYVTMFMSAVKDKATYWYRTMGSVLRTTDYSIHKLIEDFNAEFQNRAKSTGKSHKDAKSHAQEGSSSKETKRPDLQKRNRFNKPLVNDKGEPLCFNCGEYGHIFRHCENERRESDGSKSKNKSKGKATNNSSGHSNHGCSTKPNDSAVPAELRDIYEGSTFSAAAFVKRDALEELLEWYDKSAPDAVYRQVKPEGVAASTPVGQEGAEDEEDVEEVVREGVPDATTIACQAMILQTHSISGTKNQLLWDSGSNVNITNNPDDLVKGTIKGIEQGRFAINTGAGPVYASAVGTAAWQLTKPDRSRLDLTMSYTLVVKEFPLKILSGEVWYRKGGYLDHNILKSPDGKALTMINVERRGFLLWTFGIPEPEISNNK